MLAPAMHARENERIKTLQSLNVLDTPAEAKLDRITHAVSRMFEVPIALISLVDSNRQWFKSCVGLAVSETSRSISFCGHTILQEKVFVINDTFIDERFKDNPLVICEPHIRFYAGCPLFHTNGMPLGTLCLIDKVPRIFDDEDQRILSEVATLVELELVNQDSITMDEISQLSNREGFLSLAKHSLDVCKKNKLNISVAFLYIKGLLNYWQQDKGKFDQVISIISEQFKQHFRCSDVVGRYDESSFIALLTNANCQTTRKSLEHLVANLNYQLKTLTPEHECQLVTGCVSAKPEEDLDALILSAFTKLHE